MTKKIWKIICIVSAVVLLIVVGIFVFMILSTPQQPNFAIIGGADYPTAAYVIGTALFHSPLFIVGILALLLFAVSGIVLMYKKAHTHEQLTR